MASSTLNLPSAAARDQRSVSLSHVLPGFNYRLGTVGRPGLRLSPPALLALREEASARVSLRDDLTRDRRNPDAKKVVFWMILSFGSRNCWINMERRNDC